MSTPLTVGELIAELQRYGSDAPVYLCLPDVTYQAIDKVVVEGLGPAEVPFPLLMSEDAEKTIEWYAEEIEKREREIHEAHCEVC